MSPSQEVCFFQAHDKIIGEEKIASKFPRMSKLTSLFLIIIFFICLLVGVYIGRIANPSTPETIPTLTPATNPSITIGSILVLGMNNFEDEQIYLESAWVATINAISHDNGNQIEVVLVGLYPLSAGQLTSAKQSQYLIPHQPIVFPKAYLENLHAFELLNSIPILNRVDIFFNDVVIVDEFGMNYIIELTNTNPQLPPPPPTENTFCRPWDNPQHAQEIQHNILETLCAPPQNILEYTNFIRVFDLVPNHLVSTLSQEDILALWQVNINLNTPPSISCKIFP